MKNIILITLILFIVSCGDKNLSKSDCFLPENIDYIEENYKDFSKEDWIDARNCYDKFIFYFDENKNELDPETREEYNRIIGRFQYITFKSKVIDEFEEDFKDFKNEYSNELETLKREFSDIKQRGSEFINNLRK